MGQVTLGGVKEGGDTPVIVLNCIVIAHPQAAAIEWREMPDQRVKGRWDKVGIGRRHDGKRFEWVGVCAAK